MGQSGTLSTTITVNSEPGLYRHNHNIQRAMESNLTLKTDRALLSGCLQGDQRCHEIFVRQFSSLVFSTILKVIKSKNAHLSEQSIEDLHQNVFLSLFDRRCRKLRQYKGKNGCSLASWVRLVTGNMVLDYLRRGMDALAPRQQIMPLEMAAELNAPEPLPIDQLTAAEQWQQIENGLRHLKTRDQLIIRLHCLDEQPLSDVAKILGVSEKNIHSVKHRAIKRLKTVIVGKKKE